MSDCRSRCHRVVGILTFLFILYCSTSPVYGIRESLSSSHSSHIRGLRIHKLQQPQRRQLSPINTRVSEESEPGYYEFDVNGVSLLPAQTKQASLEPSKFPSTESPTSSPTNEPSISPTKSPSDGPTKEPIDDTPRGQPTDPPSTSPPVSEAPSTESPTTKPTSLPTKLPTDSPSAADSRIMEEVAVQAQEQDVAPAPAPNSEGDFLPEDETEEFNQREPSKETSPQFPAVEEVPSDAADQFLPADEPDYYYVDLRPFSVFVKADRDLTTDLSIPLYLLLEMGETLTTLVDIKITNLTIHMGVVGTHQHVRRGQEEEEEEHSHNHYHWNELFFHGLAQFDDSTVYPPVTVQNVQALVLSNEAALQKFWDDQGYGETYDNLELQNITLLEFPETTVPETEAPTAQEEVPTQPTQPTQSPQGEAGASTEPEDSKRDSNIWIMVPLILVFLMICFCIICFAGRLQYLSSRAQDKYNEKYGLDYNIYDKDIGKEIFKEEYLMSEHQDDPDFSQGHLSDSVRSIDFLTKPISSIKTATRRSSAKQVKKPVPAPDEHSTEEEEEEMPASYTDGAVRKVFPEEEARYAYYSHNGPMASARSENRRSETSEETGAFPTTERAIDHKEVVDEGIIIPKLQHEAESPERTRDEEGPIESVPPDEDTDIMPRISGEVANDKRDAMPSLIEIGGNAMADTCEKDASARSTRSRDSPTMAPKERSGMGNSSGRDRSGRLNRSSFNAGEDRSVGNSSRGSRGDRSSRFNRNFGSFGAGNGEESNAMGNSSRGDRSTRSNRSIRSTSESSFGSFYSCQGDLV